MLQFGTPFAGEQGIRNSKVVSLFSVHADLCIFVIETLQKYAC